MALTQCLCTAAVTRVWSLGEAATSINMLPDCWQGALLGSCAAWRAAARMLCGWALPMAQC